MLITFTLSHIYCEVVKRVGSNKHETKFKIAHKESKEDFLRGKFLKSVLNATEKGKVEIWDASKVVSINDSCFCLNDNYTLNYEMQYDTIKDDPQGSSLIHPLR